MKSTTMVLFPLIAALSFAAGAALERSHQAAELSSCILREAGAKQSTGTWGSIRIYTPDRTPTCGTGSLLTAELEFLPGQRLQPPHRHADEELQYVISGRGTWHLNGQDIPLEKGDLMYARPGDLHGIANSGSEPLRFLVVKWVARGAETPAP